MTSDDAGLERCRQLAFEAARLAHGRRADAPRRFELGQPGNRWRISSEEPWLQRLELTVDEATGRSAVHAHVPAPGRDGPAGWDGDAAEKFGVCLRGFVAEHDLPMLLRFDIELVIGLSAVADDQTELRRRVVRATEAMTRQLTAVTGDISIEIFPGDAWTRRARRSPG